MTSEKKATRSQKKGAKEILRLGLKALSYRRDLLPQDEVDALSSTTTALQESLSVKSVTVGELEEKAKAGNAAAKRVMQAWADAEWFTSRPEVAEKITFTVY